MSHYLGKVIVSVVCTTFFTCCFLSNVFAKAIDIEAARVSKESIQITGVTSISPKISTYIQYYVGKQYPGTLSCCVLSGGFQVSDDGSFEKKMPVASLKGVGNYEIALEQNPGANTILAPEHWVAFRKTDNGIAFGDISSMGEISNLALTVGMELAKADFFVK